MRTRVTGFALALALGLGAVTAPRASAHAPLRASPERAHPQNVAAKCVSTGYTQNCTGCAKIKASGTYTLKAPNSSITLTGKGTARGKGTTICVSQLAPPVKSKSGKGIRVTATGSFSPMKLKGHKTIYKYSPKTNALKKVTKISAPGIYQIV